MEKKLRPLNEIEQLQENFLSPDRDGKAKAMERNLLLNSDFGSADARAEVQRELDQFVSNARADSVTTREPDQTKPVWDLLSDGEKINSIKKQLDTLEKKKLVDEATIDNDNDTADAALSTAQGAQHDIDRMIGTGLTDIKTLGRNLEIYTKVPHIYFAVSVAMPNGSTVSATLSAPGDVTYDYFDWDVSNPERIEILSGGRYLLLVSGGSSIASSTLGKQVRVNQKGTVWVRSVDRVGNDVVIDNNSLTFEKFCRMPGPWQFYKDLSMIQTFEIDDAFGPYYLYIAGAGTYEGSGGAHNLDPVTVDGQPSPYDEYQAEYYDMSFGGSIIVLKIA